jgi:hypothetical protein
MYRRILLTVGTFGPSNLKTNGNTMYIYTQIGHGKATAIQINTTGQTESNKTFHTLKNRKQDGELWAT